MSGSVLELRGLEVTYPGPPAVRAVDGVDLSVARGECLGVLGESGSGKSTLARAVLGLVPEARVHGDVRLDGLDLRTLGESGWRAVRWRRIALAFQSTAALNPVLRVLDQVAEPLEVHLGLRRGDARGRAADALGAVGLDLSQATRYPSELSGGQRRLALLAMATVCEPELLMLDEPTSGLDAVTRDRVLELLGRLRAAGTTIVVLGHDVETLARIADRVAVLYRGWLAELGPAAQVLPDPRHPYSRGLLNARPTLATVKELRGIRGRRPNPAEVATGCPFAGRCTQEIEECTLVRPPLVPPTGEEDGRLVACIRGGVVPLLVARGLSKAYRLREGLGRRRVPAVDGISLELREGEIVGVVGSTGAGKSTLGLLLAGLLAPDAGTVVFAGNELAGDGLRAARRRLQMVFQDPFEALSPRLTVLQAVREPLEVQGLASGGEAVELVRRSLTATRLPADDTFLGRHTHELSGGELQRAALARALVLDPKVLVLDEPVAMLDPSEQAELLQLIKALQVERGLAVVLVSHDLASVLRLADRVIVLDHGRVVEEASGTALLVAPRHPVTRALLDAAGRDALFPQEPAVEPALVHDVSRLQEVRT